MPKISQYTDGGAIQSSDKLVISRSGANYSVLGSEIGSGKYEGLMQNGKLSVTVSSNNLTVAVKTFAGTDPSQSNPVSVYIRGVKRTISSPLSLTINAGTNTFAAGSAVLATKEIDYFTYLSWRAASSKVVLLASRISWANVYGDFSATVTNEKYAAFSTAPASTDDVVVIGRFAATLSAGAGYTWTVPTFTSANLVQSPIFTTRLLSFNPSPTGFSGSPTVTGTYMLRQNMMTFFMTISGTSNDTAFTATLPYTPVSASNDLQRLVDNGSAVAGLVALSGATVIFYSSFAAAGWTNSGTKGVEAVTKTVLC